MFLEHFYMVDTVDRLDVDKGIIHCSATVPDESPILGGHFPGFPIMPGVILTETIAQSAGYLCYAESNCERMPFLVGIENAKFKGFVLPGQAMTIEVERKKQTMGVSTFRGRIYVERKIVCQAKIRLRAMAFPTERLEEHMKDRSSSVGLATLTA